MSRVRLVLHAVRASHPSSLSGRLGHQTRRRGIAVLVFEQPLFYFKMTPKCESGDAGPSDMPKTSLKVLPVSEKLEVL